MGRMVLVAAAAYYVVAAWPLGAQSPPPGALRDPFRGAPVVVDRCIPRRQCGAPAPVQRALELAGLSEKGFAMRVATHALGADTLIFVQGWTGEGTGYAETGVLVFRPVGRDSAAAVFQGLVGARRTPWRPVEHDPAFTVRGCLLLAGRDAIAYYHYARGAGAASADSEVVTRPPPRDGYFRWAGAGAGFVFVAPPDARLKAACPRQRTLLDE